MKIDPSQHISVMEGQNLNICCSLSSALSYECSYLRWFDGKRGKELQVDLNKTCLYLSKTNRNDSSTYTCINEKGIEAKNATIDVMCR